MSGQEEEPRDADGSGERPAVEDAQRDDLDAREDDAAEVKGGPSSVPWDKA